MIELILAVALQAHNNVQVCELELNIPTGTRRRDPKTFDVDCPSFGTGSQELQEAAEAHFDRLDLDFRHADWMYVAETVYFRFDSEAGWVPEHPQMMISAPPEMPRRITNRGFRDLECSWMAYPEADGQIEAENYECRLDGEDIPENLERLVRRTLNQALEASRILPETPGECVQDVIRVSAFIYRYHYAFGWEGDGIRRSPNSRFSTMCPAAGPDPDAGPK